MTKLGKKFKHFGKIGKKAGRSIVKFGKKATHEIDVGSRKALNTIDKAVPYAAIVADSFVPGSGEALIKGNDGLQSLNKSVRRLAHQIPKLGGPKSKEREIEFGNNVNNVKKDFNRTTALLRN
jgi:hypothetical protein